MIWPFHIPVCLIVPIAVGLAGEIGQAFPVSLSHHGVVHRAVAARNLQETSDDAVGLTGYAATVVDVLAPVFLAERELIALVDNHRVVGILYLPCLGAKYQFSVAGDCKVASRLVEVLPLCVLASAIASRQEVAQSLCARLQREATHGKVDEGKENGHTRTLAQAFTVAQLVVEVHGLAFIRSLAAFFPNGVVNVDELLAHIVIAYHVRGFERLDDVCLI